MPSSGQVQEERPFSGGNPFEMCQPYRFCHPCGLQELIKEIRYKYGKETWNGNKNRKVNIPFKGMRFDQKRAFSEIVCKDGEDESKYKILLIDFAVEDSKVEKEDVIVEVPDGNGGTRSERQTRPKKCLVIRYKRILKTVVQTSVDGEETEIYEFEKEKDKNGNLTAREAEYYSYTGSTVMLEQAGNDFMKEDLPCPTVITEFTNKLNKKFYKFT